VSDAKGRQEGIVKRASIAAAAMAAFPPPSVQALQPGIFPGLQLRAPTTVGEKLVNCDRFSGNVSSIVVQ
jgi:hypothetical protein